LCCDLDIDVNADLYSYFKFKQMVNGIPVMLCFAKDNLSFVPNESFSGINLKELDNFFKACNKQLQDIK
jgi:hypothetical protein